ncbi:hypothetical protein [Lactobacillus delbrueckii]|nr:hypothetical protein [Lactobacillus delbrueckii]
MPIAGLAQGSEVASGQEAINLATRRSKSRAGKIGTFKASGLAIADGGQ